MKQTETTPMSEDLIASATSDARSENLAGTEILSPNAMDSSTQQGLSPAVQKHIGNLLKVSYQDLLTETVPDRFADLLNQLELAEKKSGEGK